MVSGGVGWCRVVSGGVGWYRVVLGGVGWCRVVSGGVGWYWVVSGGVGWCWGPYQLLEVQPGAVQPLPLPGHLQGPLRGEGPPSHAPGELAQGPVQPPRRRPRGPQEPLRPQDEGIVARGPQAGLMA